MSLPAIETPVPESYGPPLPLAFYLQDTLVVAQALLGCILIHASPEGLTAGRISETEAYRSDDPASHAFRGQTARNATMFGPPGHAYIYLTYGMHYCLNAVTAPEGVAEAVLLRAVEPLAGVELMRRRRGLSEMGANPNDEKARIRLGRALCGGPGKLCQAFGLDRTLNGCDLTVPARLWIASAGEKKPEEASRIVATPRIGITQAVDRLWRFTLRGDLYTSRSQ
ncbi:MAG TPA: DNA-3-methyladenine glycosylase [Chthonomonadaceae bacterium]|nr:DNA-3-methyladenine glycosylase [Chthonomonadaceae bacterium]